MCIEQCATDTAAGAQTKGTSVHVVFNPDVPGRGDRGGQTTAMQDPPGVQRANALQPVSFAHTCARK
eukprot:2548125-Lingulodinium_polyedra.AAC.1